MQDGAADGSASWVCCRAALHGSAAASRCHSTMVHSALHVMEQVTSHIASSAHCAPSMLMGAMHTVKMLCTTLLGPQHQHLVLQHLRCTPLPSGARSAEVMDMAPVLVAPMICTAVCAGVSCSACSTGFQSTLQCMLLPVQRSFGCINNAWHPSSGECYINHLSRGMVRTVLPHALWKEK